MKDDQVFQRQNNDILIVDDSAPNLKFLSEILCADGYLVRQAINGNMALQRLKEKLPAIVLLDVMMPEMDGFEVCRRLKEDETTKFIPVIFISALDDEQSKLQGFMVGGADYITKPFRKDEVLARVKAHINLRNVQLELEAQKNRLINEIEERKITEEKLRESEERFRTTLYGIGDGVITTDNHGLIQLMNSVAEDLTGWTQAEASGKNLEDVFRIINEETRIQVEIPVRKVIREGVVVGLANHTLLISKDGTERPIADSGAPIRNERGEIVGVILVFRDQTEERNAEKALKESEEKYRFLFDNNPLPMWIFNMETLAFLNVNEAAIYHYGYSREEFLTMTLKEIRPKKDIPALLTAVSNQTERLNRIGVFKHKKKNGELIDVEMVSHQIDYEGSRAMLIVSSDVTERVKAENDLKESELRFRNIFEQSSVGKSMTGIDGTLQVNRAFIEMLGYNEEELKGKNWIEVSHPDDLQKTNQLIDDLLEGKIQKARFEKRYIHKKGNVVWADVSTFLQRDHEGIPQYFITSINNITQRKLDEEKINQQNNRLNAIIEAMPDLIFVSDREGHYLEFFNPKALELLYPSEHLIGVSVREVFDAPTAELHIRKINECLEQKKLTNYEYYGMKDDVHTIYEARIVYLEEDRVLRFVRDITERRRSEEVLKESEEKFRKLAESTPIAICIYQNDKWVYVNPAAEKMSEFEAGELYQQNYWDFVGPEFQDMIKNQAAKRLSGKKAQDSYEFRAITKSGKSKWVYLHGTGILYNGRPAGLVSLLDLTEKKESEKLLNESEELYRSIFRSSLAAMLLIDPDSGQIVDANDAAVQFYGWPYSRITSMKMSQIDKLSLKNIKNEMQKVTESSRNYFVFKHRIANGDIRDVEVYSSSIILNNRNLLFSIIHDITERKNAELALLEANQKMDSFFNHSLDGFFFMMLDEPIEWNEKADKEQLLEYVFLHQRITRINEAMLDQYGATSDQFIGMTPKDMFGHNIEHGKNEWRKLFDQGKLHTETDERKLNGEQIFIEGDYICQYDSKGRITGHFGIQRDVTQNKMAVDAIKNERKLLRTLIDNLPVTIYVKDQGTRKIVANSLDLEVMGILDEADVLGKTDLELFGNEIGQRGYADDLKVIQTGQSVINREEVFLDKDGFQRWLLTSKIPLFDHQGNPTGLVGIGRDITEMKKAENQIKKLTKSIEQSPSSIVITDIQGNIEYVNPMFSEISGYSKDEVIGKNPRILKSGEMPAEVYSQMWNTIKAGEVWRGEFLNRKKNGELYWEWATMTSIKNEDGEITNYLSIKEDISLRKQMEADLIIAKNKAEESDRLKSAFLANMSHEIRTPLNSIIGFSELLSDSDFEIDEKKEFIQHIISNGNSLLNIISDIMDISRMESGQVTIRESQIHVNKFITGIKEQFSIKFAETNVEFKLEIPNSKEEIFILADTDRLSQIFTNLISNALKFTTQGFIQIGYQVKGDMVEFCVTDTGIGIPADFHDKIFDRFRQVESSNTRKYGGNGLGLAITRNLVELMGGKIWIESESGKGSSFYFVLPLFSGN